MLYLGIFKSRLHYYTVAIVHSMAVELSYDVVNDI